MKAFKFTQQTMILLIDSIEQLKAYRYNIYRYRYMTQIYIINKNWISNFNAFTVHFFIVRKEFEKAAEKEKENLLNKPTD